VEKNARTSTRAWNVKKEQKKEQKKKKKTDAFQTQRTFQEHTCKSAAVWGNNYTVAAEAVCLSVVGADGVMHQYYSCLVRGWGMDGS
jgi:hypothetical protein